MNQFRGDITPAFAFGNRGMQPLTDEQERLQRLLEAIILKTPGGVAKSIGEGIQTGVDVVGSIGQLDKAEQLGRQARRTLPDIVSAVTEQPGAVASALGQGLEQDVLDKGLGAFVGVEDAVPVVGKAGKFMGGIGAAAMMSKMPKMSKQAQDIVDASKPTNDFYDSILAEMEDGPLKDELLAEATQFRTRQNELAKFVNETTPAPARVKFNMRSDGSAPAQLLLTKSAKEKGKWQGTIVDEQGPLTHISRSEYGDVVKELSQSYPQIIDNLKNAEIVDVNARARQMQKASFGTPAYHGTTHDIQEFTLERSNPENYLGQAHYFSSSPIDASENYGGQGPDLTNRIDLEVENLDAMTDGEIKEMVSKEVADQFDRDMKRVDESEQDNLRQSLVREAAKAKLTTHEGAVMDVQLQLKNPLYIDGSDKEQRFKLEAVYDDDGDVIDEKGNLVDLHQAIVDAGYEFDGGNGDELAGAFMEQASDYFGDKMYDEGLTATDVNYILQNMEKSDLYTDDGSFAGNEFIRQVYENLGHDSVVMDASKAFKMENVPEGTKHYIVFDKYANQIRSRRAKFDPKKSDSRNILASTLPIGLGAGAAAYTANEE
jgi:hypothetical protein